jgi:DNA-directed RNA polymerase specialized sigma24 family protein
MPSPRPTNRPAAGASLTPQRRDALSAFYSAQHGPLAIRVYHCVDRITPHDLQDACSFAWLQLSRRPDIDLDRRGIAWLSTVAIREGRRLTPTPDQDQPADRSMEPGDPLEHALTRCAHDERVRRFAQLHPDQRRDLLLFAAGYSYRQIAAMNASTYTAVNHNINRGRARLLNH